MRAAGGRCAKSPMSKWIDALLEALRERGAEALVLASGAPPALRFGGTDQPISRQCIAIGHLEALVRQAGGSELWREIEATNTATWIDGPQGRRWRFVASGDGSNLNIEVTPKSDEAEPEGPTQGSQPGAPVAVAAVAAAAGSGATSPALASPALAHHDPARIQEIEAMLRATHAQGCSDLHLSANMPPLVRKDGVMQPLDSLGIFPAERIRDLVLSITPPRNLDELERMWDTDFGHEISSLCRFRVNVFHDRQGMGAVFRVIPTKMPRPEDLGLPARLVEMTQLSKGIVLVTGPTGSGKSTTLAALVNHINDTRHDHVITIEDPIEFVHESRNCLINQREVGSHTQTFKRALREALREDPDIVLVGEMRDLETVHIALETAETGHLVFGTLHTTSAPATIDRLIDQFPAGQQAQIRVMLADTLRCVVAQVLCRRKTGGRVAALELMVCTNAMANLIREGKTHQIPSIMQTSKAEGMQLMTEALVRLVQDDVIDAEEALARATDRDDVLRTLERLDLLPQLALPRGKRR